MRYIKFVNELKNAAPRSKESFFVIRELAGDIVLEKYEVIDGDSKNIYNETMYSWLICHDVKEIVSEARKLIGSNAIIWIVGYMLRRELKGA